MTSTPIYTFYGVVDQQDLDPNFYFHQIVYDPVVQTPWAVATPIPYSYGPHRPPIMPPVK